jgi:hypothetical protein
MKVFKYICILLFLVILGLFTVAYSTLPLLNATAEASVNIPLNTRPTGPNGINFPIDINGLQIPSNMNTKLYFLFYTDKIINNSDGNKTIINYSDINSTVGNISSIIKYILITVSVCIGLVVILSFIGMKMLSYIPLIFSQIVMILLAIIIVVLYSTRYLTDIITQNINSQTDYIKLSNAKISFENGGILIIISSLLLIVTHFIYSMLG